VQFGPSNCQCLLRFAESVNLDRWIYIFVAIHFVLIFARSFPARGIVLLGQAG